MHQNGKRHLKMNLESGERRREKRSGTIALMRSDTAVERGPGRSPDSQVTAFQTAFPLSETTVAICSAETLAAYSGATVRELHPLPFSLAGLPRAPGTHRGKC